MIINSTGIGTVTRKMVRERATKLALINGRSVQDVSVADWEQAKRELTGGWDIDPKEALLEAAPEAERWDPLPGSTGHIIPVASIDGEDDDGRSMGEKLIDEGVQEAEHDQMLQAARANEKKGSARRLNISIPHEEPTPDFSQILSRKDKCWPSYLFCQRCSSASPLTTEDTS